MTRLLFSKQPVHLQQIHDLCGQILGVNIVCSLQLSVLQCWPEATWMKHSSASVYISQPLYYRARLLTFPVRQKVALLPKVQGQGFSSQQKQETLVRFEVPFPVTLKSSLCSTT